MFRKLDDDRTLHSQIHLYNCGAWSKSSTISKLVIPARGADIQKSMLNYLKKQKQQSAPIDGLSQCVRDCKMEEQRAKYNQKETNLDTSYENMYL